MMQSSIVCIYKLYAHTYGCVGSIHHQLSVRRKIFLIFECFIETLSIIVSLRYRSLLWPYARLSLSLNLFASPTWAHPTRPFFLFYHQSYGDTLLTYAAIKGQVDIIEKLLFAGADIDSTDKVFDMHYLFVYVCMYIFICEWRFLCIYVSMYLCTNY